MLGLGPNGNFHAGGTGQYGNGTYAAGAAAGSKFMGDARGVAYKYAAEAQPIKVSSRQTREALEESISRSVISFGLRSDANVKEFKDNTEFKNWQKEVIEKAKKETGTDFRLWASCCCIGYPCLQDS